MSESATWATNWGNIVQKAWTDEPFKNLLLTNPQQAFQNEGIPLPSNVTVTVQEARDASWVNGGWKNLPAPQLLAVLYLPPPPPPPDVAAALDSLKSSFQSATSAVLVCC